MLRLLSYTPATAPRGGARYKTISSGPGGDRTRIFEQRTRGLPVGRQARERWWSQRESNPHDRCAKPASCHWMMAPSVKGGGTPRCRTGTSWVSSRRADRYARVPWCRRGASRAGERDLAGCQRSPRSGRADVVCAARHGGSVGCQPWIRTTVIRVKVGGPAVGRAGIRVCGGAGGTRTLTSAGKSRVLCLSRSGAAASIARLPPHSYPGAGPL